MTDDASNRTDFELDIAFKEEAKSIIVRHAKHLSELDDDGKLKVHPLSPSASAHRSSIRWAMSVLDAGRQ